MSTDVLGDRFWSKVEVIHGGCWEWTASKTHDGYPRYTVTPKREVKAHRLAYEVFVGPIPHGYQIDHQCRNPSCVNPAHLKAVTQSENLQNRSGAMKNSKTGMRGVHYIASRNRYVATAVGAQGRVTIGFFKEAMDAHRAACLWRARNYSNSIADAESIKSSTEAAA